MDIKNKQQLDSVYSFVVKILKIDKDEKFQKFMQEKALETVRRVSDELLIGGTTDDEYIEEYKSRHKIQETSDGFVLYNDTVIPPSMLPISEANAQNYPNGFSIALAFEYGIGIVGENSPKPNAWEYNVNNWNFAWHYKKYEELYSTYGYEGFQIYYTTANEIKKNLTTWLDEYMRKEV